MFSEYLWVVVLGSMFAFAASFGIGANDVANAFATSVGAKSLTLRQAIVIAGVCEFAGAFALGSHVTSTIRDGITDASQFSDFPELLMFGMLCVIFSTAVWLVVATKLHMPVSTTQATVGGIIGIALVARGSDAVQWSGVGLIVASWFVSPILSAALSGGIFWAVRRFVLRSEHPFDNALISLPFLVGITLAVNVFFIVYEGPEALSETPVWAAVAAAVGAGLLTAVVVYFFVIPRVRRNVKADERAGLVPAVPPPVDSAHSQSTSDAAHLSPAAVVLEMPSVHEGGSLDSSANEAEASVSPETDSVHSGEGDSHDGPEGLSQGGAGESAGGGADTPDGENIANKLLPAESPPVSLAADGTGSKLEQSTGGGWRSRLAEGFNHDIHADAAEGTGDATVTAMHSQGEEFEPRTERVFTYLQVVTACFDSFGHGANDVANSIGPLAAIVAIYETSSVTSEASVPLWILALGGVGIVVGLATLGYEIIKAIGVRLSKITPSRGFTIEIGAAFVIVVGSRLGLPLSTTQAQIGSTVGVALLEGRRDAVNWKALARVFVGWVLTLVVTGTLAASLFAFCVYAPSVPSGPLHAASGAAGNNTIGV